MRFPVWSLLLGCAFSPVMTMASPPPSRVTSTDQGEQTNQIEVASEEAKVETPAKNPADTKYFHEPGGDAYLTHYDSRYFHGKLEYDERRTTLLHMIRAYLIFFREQGIETWIAHGTLLGWWWNGKMLPWDWDIDTQVSANTLFYMGEHLNQTIQRYTTEDGQVREYLIDVNPWIWERERGDGANIIDARWIDTSNGLYIDITGLSETHPDNDPGVWSCKNYHRYRTVDLYPLRDTLYEGVPARIPYAYDKILREEYQQKAMILTEYENHRWVPAQKEWLRVQAPTKRNVEPVEQGSKSLRRRRIEPSGSSSEKKRRDYDFRELIAPQAFEPLNYKTWWLYTFKDLFLVLSNLLTGLYWGSKLKEPIHMWFCCSSERKKRAQEKTQGIFQRIEDWLFPVDPRKRTSRGQDSDLEQGQAQNSENMNNLTTSAGSGDATAESSRMARRETSTSA